MNKDIIVSQITELEGLIENAPTTTAFKLEMKSRLDKIKENLLTESLKEDIKELFPDDDRVTHPHHYTWLKDLCGVEVIDITRHMDFDLGNAIKYILRNGHKSEQGMSNKEKAIEDLKKATFYLNDKIKMIEVE